MTITPAETLDALEWLHQRATPAPWYDDGGYRVRAGFDGTELAGRHPSDQYQLMLFEGKHFDGCSEDMSLCALARNALPSLIAAARRVHALERENAHLRSRLKNSTMPLTNEQQLIDALERVKEAEALIRKNWRRIEQTRDNVGLFAALDELHAWLKQAESPQ